MGKILNQKQDETTGKGKEVTLRRGPILRVTFPTLSGHPTPRPSLSPFPLSLWWEGSSWHSAWHSEEGPWSRRAPVITPPQLLPVLMGCRPGSCVPPMHQPASEYLDRECLAPLGELSHQGAALSLMSRSPLSLLDLHSGMSQAQWEVADA